MSRRLPIATRPPRCARAYVLVAVALAGLPPLHAQAPPAWPDTYLARLEALALIQTLNAEILASRSATASLEHWCREHQGTADARIVADVVPGAAKAPAADQRERLEVGSDGDVRYRLVRLRCGGRVLSEAENWYVPGRLTPEMNRLLETTTTPFGKAVESLEPYRRTFAVTLLWTPLPDGWERAASLPAPTGSALAIPDALLEHRALLHTREHKPFAEVREIYQRAILACRHGPAACLP
jgi:chorismate-pyruvate lyase